MVVTAEIRQFSYDNLSDANTWAPESPPHTQMTRWVIAQLVFRYAPLITLRSAYYATLGG